MVANVDITLLKERKTCVAVIDLFAKLTILTSGRFLFKRKIHHMLCVRVHKQSLTAANDESVDVQTT